MWAPDGLPFGNMNDGAQESRTGSGAALAGVQAPEALQSEAMRVTIWQPRTCARAWHGIVDYRF